MENIGLDLNSLVEAVLPYINALIVAALVIVFDQAVRYWLSRHENSTRVLYALRLAVWGIGSLLILRLFITNAQTLGEILVAGSLVIGLIVNRGFGNIVAGVINIVLTDVLARGDVVVIGDDDENIGIVQKITLFSVKVQHHDGSETDYPQTMVQENAVRKWEKEDNGYRMKVRVDIDHAPFDLEKTKKVIQQVLNQDERWRAFGRDPFVQMEAISDSSNVLYAYAWITSKWQEGRLKPQLLELIVLALTKKEISFGQTANNRNELQGCKVAELKGSKALKV